MLILLVIAALVGVVILIARAPAVGLPVLVAGVLVIAASWALVDPYADIPVVSQVVCSAKGDSWYGGGVLGAADCYTRP